MPTRRRATKRLSKAEFGSRGQPPWIVGGTQKCYVPPPVKNSFPIQVRTLSGLEPVLLDELVALGAEDCELGHRLVSCRGDRELLYAINFWSRVAIRVLRPIAAFAASDEKAFYRGIQDHTQWERWLDRNGAFAIDAHVHSSFSSHSLYIAQLAKDAIADQFLQTGTRRPSVDLEAPDLRIALSLYENRVQVFLDSSGESLHKRGYRTQSGEAPLKENLAAGILRLAKWDPKTPLADAMCGSGTFLIEGAMIARNIAPGLYRPHFGFKNWPDYDPGLFAKVKKGAEEARTQQPLQIWGIEKDAKTAFIARENIERAGLSDCIRVDCHDFFTYAPPAPAGTLVLNPPYDHRLAVEDIAGFYQSMGDRLKQAYGGWRAWILAGELEAARHFGLRSSSRHTLYNGAIECRLLEFEVRAASTDRELPPWRQKPTDPKLLERAEAFANRVSKNHKHLVKWAKREGIRLWRVYDWDIPDLAFTVDWVGDRLRVVEIPRNSTLSSVEQAVYLRYLGEQVATKLGIAPDLVDLLRKQATEAPSLDRLTELEENGTTYLVDSPSPHSLGMELALRGFRQSVCEASKDRELLVLSAGNGALSAAACAYAKRIWSAEPDAFLGDWMQAQIELNGGAAKHQVLPLTNDEALSDIRRKFDCIAAPLPEKSLQENQIRRMLKLLEPQGALFLVSNETELRFSDPKFTTREITRAITPLDFAKKMPWRAWTLSAH